MWLLAIETTSIPASFTPAMSRGSAEKTVPCVWYFGASGAGFSKFATAMFARDRRWRTAPVLPVRLAMTVGQPRAEQQRCPVMSAVPPSNGKSTPLPRMWTSR